MDVCRVPDYDNVELSMAFGRAIRELQEYGFTNILLVGTKPTKDISLGTVAFWEYGGVEGGDESAVLGMLSYVTPHIADYILNPLHDEDTTEEEDDEDDD